MKLIYSGKIEEKKRLIKQTNEAKEDDLFKLFT